MRDLAGEAQEQAIAAGQRAERAGALARDARERAREAAGQAAAAGMRARDAEERAAAAEKRAREAEARTAAALAPPPEPVSAAAEPPASVAEYAETVRADRSLLGALGDVTAAAQRARALMARHDLALRTLAGLEGVSRTPSGVTDGTVRVHRFRSAGLLHAALEGRTDLVRDLHREAVTDG